MFSIHFVAHLDLWGREQQKHWFCSIMNKNLAIASRSRVSCAHNTLRAFIDLNIIIVTLKSRLRVTQGHWKRNHWTDHTRLTISRVIWR